MFKLVSNNGLRSIIAIKDIEKNTTLFSEEINFYADKDKFDWYEDLLWYELNNNYDKFLDLVPTQKDQYIISDGIFKKKYHQILNENLDLNILYNKIIRNAFNVRIKNKSYATILYKGRKFNHSCEPNVQFKLNEINNKLYMNFYVSRNVKKEEELFDNYFDIDLPYKDRQLISQKYYGFKCNCKKCLTKI
jgi:hypothetical protein